MPPAADPDSRSRPSTICHAPYWYHPLYHNNYNLHLNLNSISFSSQHLSSLQLYHQPHPYHSSSRSSYLDPNSDSTSNSIHHPRPNDNSSATHNGRKSLTPQQYPHLQPPCNPAPSSSVSSASQAHSGGSSASASASSPSSHSASASASGLSSCSSPCPCSPCSLSSSSSRAPLGHKKPQNPLKTEVMAPPMAAMAGARRAPAWQRDDGYGEQDLQAHAGRSYSAATATASPAFASDSPEAAAAVTVAEKDFMREREQRERERAKSTLTVFMSQPQHGSRHDQSFTSSSSNDSKSSSPHCKAQSSFTSASENANTSTSSKGLQRDRDNHHYHYRDKTQPSTRTNLDANDASTNAPAATAASNPTHAHYSGLNRLPPPAVAADRSRPHIIINKHNNILNNVNDSPASVSASRRHQTVDLSKSAINNSVLADTTVAADCSAFMYDDDASLRGASPSPQRRYKGEPAYLDEALADPCGSHPADDSDLDLEEYNDSQSQFYHRAAVREITQDHLDPDTSMNSFHSTGTHHTQTDEDADFSRQHTPADFAKFIAASRSTPSNTNTSATSVTRTPQHKDLLQQQQETGGDETYQKFVSAMAGIYDLSDQQLEDRFSFEREIGFGNWGSVWQCRLRESNSHRNSPGRRLGRAAAMNGGLGAQGRVAIKLAHRGKEATNTQRVHALWHEMKVIRSLRHDTHPSIIEFEAFIITPGYALIVMPFHSHLIEVKIPVQRARPYFRALASAVGYLHERGITHNDIKPANIVMTYNDVPVLVDFGFAKKHELGSPGRFLSTVRMGTPEYLDPQRVVGQPHDERASDVWSLGVTFYEILVGRTPFEWDEEETFDDERLPEYWHRTRAGNWLGDWEMPTKMEGLLRYMICPDPIHRISALQAYHHPALQPSKESLNPSTPHFVREAVYEPDNEAQEAYEEVRARKLKNVKSDVGAVVRKKKQREDRQVTPLGESIKQHTSADQLRSKTATPTSRLREDGNVTKRAKSKFGRARIEIKQPANKVKQRVTVIEKENLQPRISDCESPTLLRPASAGALLTTATDMALPQTSEDMSHLNVSSISQPDFTASPTPAKSREEAMQRTMRHLEGNAMAQARQAEDEFAAQREVIPMKSFEGAASREEAVLRALKMLEGRTKDIIDGNPAFSTVPLRSGSSMPRAHTMDIVREIEKQSSNKDLASAISDHLAVDVPSRPTTPRTPRTPVRNSRLGSAAPMLDVNISTGSIFPPSLSRPRVMSVDAASALRNPSLPAGATHGTPPRGRGNGRDHTVHPMDASPARRAKQSTAPDAVGQKEDNLDRLAEWAKTIESYVESARKARAEGRAEPAMPVMLEEHFSTIGFRALSPVAQAAAAQAAAAQVAHNDFGTKVLPDVPVIEKRSSRRGERPHLSQLFHRREPEADKDKKHPQVLRRMAARIPTRKSESQLNTSSSMLSVSQNMPRVRRKPDEVDNRQENMETLRSSWRRSNTSANLLSPPVDYTMLAPPAEPGMGGNARMTKPSSMVSLRDRARALLGDKDKDRLAHKASQSLPRNSRSIEFLRQDDGRPQTPGGQSMFGKRKGLFKLFKREKV